jgi:hypothetical protein
VSTVDLFFLGQSNVFQTDTRDGPANILQQGDVPAWIAIQLGVGTDLRLKATPWQPLDARYQTLSYNSSRKWCGVPEFCVRRLVDTYAHAPRLIKYAVGASRFQDQWPDGGHKLTTICKAQIAASLASTKYAGTPSRRIIVVIHGESDAQVTASANAYETSLDTVVSAIRTTLGDADTHAIIVQLNSNAVVGGDGAVATVRTAQAAWVTAQGGTKATLLDSSAYALSADSIHYSQSGAQGLGEGLADTIDGLL